MKLRRIGIVFLMIVATTGCVNVATTGAQAFYNHQSIQKSINDQMTTFHVYQALNNKSHDFKDANISVTTYNNEVLLAGQVRYEWQKAKLDDMVKHMSDVQHVYNLVTIANPSSPLTRLSDAWLTAKVKAKLIASSDVDATQIKVMTENGTVYLMGVLQPGEASAAVDVARSTDGVQGVVKVFSYIMITKNDPNRLVQRA
jgi:osmotically-inducible protein OsmY